ncbi:MAG: hypothetical protein ACREQZ_07545 [Woeseiaceae bacterium]
MFNNRHYDTVAFDVRNDAAILFFARTTARGDIADYLLLMHAEGEEFVDSIYLEMNDGEFSGHDCIAEAAMTGNVLTIMLNEPATELNGATELVITFDDTDENRANVETGAFRVLADKLRGGHA